VSLVAFGQSARVSLRWKPVPSASKYQLQIAKDVGFKSVVIDQTLDQPGYRWDELPTVPYYWRVRTIDAEKRQGEWSAPQTLAPAVGPPVVTSPEDDAAVVAGEAAAEFEVQLEPSRLLKGYAVELARDARFADVVARQRSATPSLRLAVPEVGTFYWRAHGVDIEGRETEAGPGRKVRVTLGAPRPARPAATVPWTIPPAATTLEWSPLLFARGFRVELTRPGGATVLVDASRPKLDVKPLGLGPHRWRVAGLDSKGALGKWSEPANFEVTLGSPVLTSPAPGAAFKRRGGAPTVTFAWAPVAAATRYRVELSADPSFPPGADARETDGPPLRVDGLASGTRHWRVTALDAVGHVSAPSAAQSFVIVLVPPLAAPRFDAPVAEAVVPLGPLVEVKWTAVTDAVAYDFELDSNPALRRVPAAALSLEGLSPGEHLVRVRACDVEGELSPWSAALGFFHGVPHAVRAEVLAESQPLVADGEDNTLLRVRLFDAKGRPVRGAKLDALAGAGSLQPLLEDEGGYVGRYVVPKTLPDSGRDDLTLTDRDFRTVWPLPLVAPGHRFAAGARAGWGSNFASLSSPFVSAEFTWRTTLWRDRVLVSARLGYLASRGWLVLQGVATPVETRTTVVPLSVVALYEHPFAALRVYGGLGPAVSFTSVVVGDAYETAPVPGLQVVAGVDRALGSGTVSLELGYAAGSFSSDLARLRSSSGSVTLGYRFDL
jgi:hypothetical protein